MRVPRMLRQRGSRHRRLRTSLALWIAVTFAVAGTALLGTQYLLADRFLASVASGVTMPSGTVQTGVCTETGQSEPSCVSDGTGDVLTVQDQYLVIAISHSQEEVARRLMTALSWWSIGGVVVFAVLASALAWWIARRSLRRLDDVSERIATITSDRLDRRIAIGGPQDEVRDLADSFDAMLDRLDEAFAAQRLFAANASHELRTPLASTRTALDVVLAQGRVPTELEPAIQRAVAATERSARILDGLLVLARVQQDESARSRLDHGDLGELLADAVERVSEAADRRDVHLEIAREFTPVVGDLDLLDQMVSNLVTNAVVHNVPGGTASFTAVRAGDRVELVVVNDGPVLDPGQVPQLVEAFHRGTSTRLAQAAAGSSGTTAGLGLGLAIVSQIVARHGGDLRLSARRTGGLVVTVSLPGEPSRLTPCPPTAS